MLRISKRDYDVFKPNFDFEAEPSGSDFYISADDDGYSWSTNGITIGKGLSSITRATFAIRNYALQNGVSGKVWLMEGLNRKFVGSIEAD